MRLKVSSTKWLQFCLGLNVLEIYIIYSHFSSSLILKCMNRLTIQYFTFTIITLPCIMLIILWYLNALILISHSYSLAEKRAPSHDYPGEESVNDNDVIIWKHFPRNWPLVRGIPRSPVNSPHKGQWRGALLFSLICVLINDWVNNREAGDLRRQRTHYDVSVMWNRKHVGINGIWLKT